MKLINDSAAPAQTATVLDRVAMSLGCSVEALSNPTSRDPDSTVELLRLWAGIKDDQDRLKVLSVRRQHLWDRLRVFTKGGWLVHRSP